MPKGRSYSAGTNRSGTKRRRVISTADSTASTDSTADGPADRPEAGRDQGVQLCGGQQTGGNVQLSSDRGKVMANDVVVVPEDGAGVDSGKEAVQPSPTDFNASRMPRTVSTSVFVNAVTEAHALRVKIGKFIKICDRNVSEMKDLEADKGEVSDQEEFE